MKRKGLKFNLALAIDDVLGHNHGLTVPNAKRHVTREYLKSKYRIRLTTDIDLEDWIIAIQVLRVDLANYFSLISRYRKNLPPREDRFENILNDLSSQLVAHETSSQYV